VVSGFAIHHLEHERKRALYREALHQEFLELLGASRYVDCLWKFRELALLYGVRPEL
jgi:hypothetical protein